MKEETYLIYGSKESFKAWHLTCQSCWHRNNKQWVPQPILYNLCFECSPIWSVSHPTNHTAAAPALAGLPTHLSLACHLLPFHMILWVHVVWCSALKGCLPCAKFSQFSKNLWLIHSVEMQISMVGIFPLKHFFFASKLGEKEIHNRINLAGLYGIYYTASSAHATALGMCLWDLWTELLDLKLTCSSAQTWSVSLYPLIHMMFP